MAKVSKESERAPMVGWYDPGVFLRTGIDTIISTIFGEPSDFRQIEALSTPAVENDQVYVNNKTAIDASKGQLYYDFRYQYNLKQDAEPNVDGNNNSYERDSEGRYVLDCAKPRDEIWFDYVADTGGGWNSTYAIAYHLTQPS